MGPDPSMSIQDSDDFSQGSGMHNPRMEEAGVLEARLSGLENIPLLLCKRNWQGTHPGSRVSVSTPFTPASHFPFLLRLVLVGTAWGAGEAARDAKGCMLFRGEHLESLIACVCYVTVFVFSNNLTF